MKLMKNNLLSTRFCKIAPVVGALLLAGSTLANAGEYSSQTAHNGPIVTQPVYVNNPFPVPTTYTSIPNGCKSFFNSIFHGCSRSQSLELALEREFWGHVQNSNFDGMSDLLSRIKSYADLSHTPYKGRLIRLTSFGNVMLSQKTRGLTIDKIPTLLSARVLGEVSNGIQPNHAFTEALNGFTDSLIKFALLQGDSGDALIEDLLDSPSDMGEYGLETALVGAMSLTYTTDINRISRGLAILNDCQDPLCTRTSSIAPFKEVGVMLTIAEAYAALGDEAGAERMVNAANAFAASHKMAAAKKAQLESFGAEIIGAEFMADSQRLTGIGMYRQPAGPSQDAAACSLCHHGAVVPDYYYSWK